MHGSLTPEQAALCAINKKRAIQLQLSLRAIHRNIVDGFLF
jgi:hypothetical protein